jgi:hypothetical protein
MRDRGATTVVIGGASLGGIASLWAASKHTDAVDGVFSLSAVSYLPPYDLTAKVIHAIRAPKLFVAGANDSSAGPYVAGWKQASTPPVRAVVLPTSTHGTDFFDDPEFLGPGAVRDPRVRGECSPELTWPSVSRRRRRGVAPRRRPTIAASSATPPSRVDFRVRRKWIADEEQAGDDRAHALAVEGEAVRVERGSPRKATTGRPAGTRR